MSNGSSGARTGISLVGALTIVFVIAKILNLIDWPWWMVFSPLWISAAISLGIVAIVLFIALIVALFGR